MANNFVVDSIYTKKLCSRLSSSEVDFFDGKRPYCVFEPLPLGGFRSNVYAIHLRLIGKFVVDFVLVMNELFSPGFTAEAL